MNNDYRIIEYRTIKRKLGDKEFKLNYNGSYIDNLAGPTVISITGEYRVFFDPGWGATNRIIFDETGLQRE